MRAVLYGSRPDGHARVVLEVLLADTDIDLVGLIDDEPENASRRLGELPVVGSRGDLARLSRQGVEGVVVGFGAAAGRAAAIEAVRAAGLALPALVHPSAYLAASASLGEGAQVLPLASLGPGTRVGAGALINTGAIVEHDARVADCSVIGPGAVLAGRVTIEESAEVGARAVILPDVIVGAHSVLGAGAVLTHSAPPGQTLIGVPAREMRQVRASG